MDGRDNRRNKAVFSNFSEFLRRSEAPVVCVFVFRGQITTKPYSTSMPVSVAYIKVKYATFSISFAVYSMSFPRGYNIPLLCKIIFSAFPWLLVRLISSWFVIFSLCFVLVLLRP